MAPEISGRDVAGQFTAGHKSFGSKPMGARNRATQLLDRAAERGAEAVLRAVLKAAKKGDIDAARLLLSRVWPARKGRPIRLDLPSLGDPGGAAAALAAIARQAAEGIISCEEAGEIAKVVEAHMRATDMLDLVRRLERLEAAYAAAAPLPASPRHAFGTPHINGRRAAG